MRRFNGRVVFEGYAMGEVFVYFNDRETPIPDFTSAENEFKRFTDSRSKSLIELDHLYEDTLKRLGEKEAALFQTHKLMAEDLDFEDLVKEYISYKQPAELAVKNASEQLAKSFAALDDDYMKLRAADALEVGMIIINILSGRDKIFKLQKPCIIVSNDLPANILMKFDRSKILGLVLVNGNVNSHVSILARTLEIPTVVAVEGLTSLSPLINTRVILDAIKGEIVTEADDGDVNKYKKLQEDYRNYVKTLESLIGCPTVSKDGFRLKLYANIASNLEIENVHRNDAEGIGLFRSEFIYLSTRTYPTEDLQFNYYREVLEDMHGKEVIIRTLDIGADKKVDYFKLPEEENPALGYRSIRICRDRPELLYTQLRSLYRASTYGQLSIMIPMIVSVDEIIFVKGIIDKVKRDLENENIPYDKRVKIGIMIETPAAALISDELAHHVDFFSIGTNDLSQYTLACDRLNPKLNNTFDSRHPAILKLIKMTIENAHKAGISCGMCGELARDPKLLPFLVGLHIDELSCSAAYILRTRNLIKDIDTRKVDINKYLN